MQNAHELSGMSCLQCVRSFAFEVPLQHCFHRSYCAVRFTSAAHDSWYIFSGCMCACKGAARAAASSAPPLPKMPPPAPRLAKASKPVPPPPKFGDPVPFRPESQATIITNNGDTPSSDGASKGAQLGTYHIHMCHNSTPQAIMSAVSANLSVPHNNCTNTFW